MLDQELLKKIEDFIAQKPRSIDEISKLIGKSWKTTDRYVDQIKQDFGTIAIRTFREGTRGALKVAYWTSTQKTSSTFQKELQTRILSLSKKEDFSPFDIYQHIDYNDKSTRTETPDNIYDLDEFYRVLSSTEKQLLIFSGNLSFLNLPIKNKDRIEIFEELNKKNVKIKVLCRVDLSGLNNINKLLSLNKKHNKELIEIRHREQPLRGIISESNVLWLKEIKTPTGKINELQESITVYYTMNSQDWIDWSTKVFWNMFNTSMLAEVRLSELERIYRG